MCPTIQFECRRLPPFAERNLTPTANLRAVCANSEFDVAHPGWPRNVDNQTQTMPVHGQQISLRSWEAEPLELLKIRAPSQSPAGTGDLRAYKAMRRTGDLRLETQRLSVDTPLFTSTFLVPGTLPYFSDMRLHLLKA